MSETAGKSFEDALGEVERVVSDLEDGRLGLDEALARYEQGVALIRLCQAQLAQAEQRVLLLTGQEPDGEAILQPFKHEATARHAGNGTKAKKNRD